MKILMTQMSATFMTRNGQAAHTYTHSHAERTSLERLHSLTVRTAATAPNHFWRYLQKISCDKKNAPIKNLKKEAGKELLLWVLHFYDNNAVL